MLVGEARRLGSAVAREAQEIGSRAVLWHGEARRVPEEAALAELKTLTGIDGYGATS